MIKNTFSLADNQLFDCKTFFDVISVKDLNLFIGQGIHPTWSCNVMCMSKQQFVPYYRWYEKETRTRHRHNSIQKVCHSLYLDILFCDTRSSYAPNANQGAYKILIYIFHRFLRIKLIIFLIFFHAIPYNLTQHSKRKIITLLNFDEYE